MANAHNFIEAFPQKYETIVGEKGLQLSLGQMQCIAIARAIIRNPSVVLLDEVTNSLDLESGQAVQEALDNFLSLKMRTTIIVTEHLTRLRDVDHIFLLDDGKVCESGVYEELMRNPRGLFFTLNSSVHPTEITV